MHGTGLFRVQDGMSLDRPVEIVCPLSHWESSPFRKTPRTSQRRDRVQGEFAGETPRTSQRRDRVQGEFAGETPRTALLWPDSGGVHHSSRRMSLSHSPRSLSRSPTREWRALPNAYIKHALAVWPQRTASYLYQESCFLEAFMTWKYVWVSSFVVYKCLCVLHDHFCVFVSFKKMN